MRRLGYNTTRVYSPITMNSEWSALQRLTIVVVLSVVGTIINGFFVTSFCIQRHLKKIGNVYLAGIGIADILITAIVMPTSAVVLLSGSWDMLEVCMSLQFTSQSSVYCYTLFFTMVSIENYIRICNTRACYAKFISIPVSFLCCLIFVIGIAVSGVGVFYDLDYNYCTREHYGNGYFRLITAVVFQIIPFSVTVVLLTTASQVVRARAIRFMHYKRSKQFDRDYKFTNLNLFVYMLFVGAWIPYLVIVNRTPDISDGTYYNCVWIGLSRSIVTSFLYSGLNRNFRQAFAHLFYYCCCKSTLASPLNSRHRTVCRAATGEVRVHMHLPLTRFVTGGSRDAVVPEL